MIHTVEGFSIVDKTEVDVFLEFPCFLYDSENVGNLISGSPAFSKPSLDIWKFLIHKMLKARMQDFKYDLTSIRDECKCPVVWTFFSTTFLRTSLVAQMVKRLPTMQKTRVQSLGREDLLEKEMATHSSILAWKIPWTEEPVGYSPWGRKESDTTEWLQLLSWELGWGLSFSRPVATAGSSRFANILSEISRWHHALGFWIALLELYHMH